LAANPFTALTLIAAPAVLTNASSVLILSTSNRLARATDRARLLAAELEKTENLNSEESRSNLRELKAAEERSILLVQALRNFYAALGGFASAALVSLLGAALMAGTSDAPLRLMEWIGLVTGVFAVANLVVGCVRMLRETRLVVAVLLERAARLAARANSGEEASGNTV
jgi:hypothetical protein